jgi:hypothetical protein
MTTASEQRDSWSRGTRRREIKGRTVVIAGSTLHVQMTKSNLTTLVTRSAVTDARGGGPRENSPVGEPPTRSVLSRTSAGDGDQVPDVPVLDQIPSETYGS